MTSATTQERLVQAARQCLLERGHQACSVKVIAGQAGGNHGLVHHYFGGRTEVFIGLVERLGAAREDQLRAPEGRNARERVADSVSRWLDWTEANRTIYLGTIAPGEDIADPEVRRVVTELVHRAVALVAALRETSVLFGAGIGLLFLGERLTPRGVLATGAGLAGLVALRL